MLSGYNTNVRHRGVLFHVQTEDSGRAHPHVISHLYYGGTILASERQGYADRVDAPDLAGHVRSLMDEQHQKLVERLKRGELDPGIEERLGGSVFSGGAKPRSDSQTHPPQGRRTPAAGSAAPPSRARSFGEGLISDRPLDEVVLEYLVENARKRKRPQG